MFDTFVSVGRNDPLFIHWPNAEVVGEDENCLKRLASHLTSFGRAEGWVEAEVVPWPGEDGLPGWKSEPAAVSDPNPVPVLCLDPGSAFADDHYPTHDPRKLRAGKVNPSDFLFNCPRWHLCLDTQTIHSERWPRVPGAMWVNYTAPASEPLPRAVPVRTASQRPTVARFLLDGPVLPLVKDSVAIAEAFRHLALGIYQRQQHQREFGTPKPYQKQFRSEVLSGKDASGKPLLSHCHAHFLSTAEGDDPRRVTHLTVYAAGGLSPEEIAAVTAIRKLEIEEEKPYHVQLIGLGQSSHFTADLFKRSSVWESVTPFVVHRHVKRRGTKKDTPHLSGTDPKAEFVKLALRELIERRGIGQLLDVEVLPSKSGPRPIEFRRSRDRHGDDGWRRPFGMFRLRFVEEVSGPICLGYACHYGLGLFSPSRA